jgi:hypothetical protein
MRDENPDALRSLNDRIQYVRKELDELSSQIRLHLGESPPPEDDESDEGDERTDADPD